MTRSNSKSLCISSLLFALVLSTASAFAQDTPDTTVAAALDSLGNRAGIVFAGEVTAIRHLDGVVEIDFHVTQNMKAANAGNYTLREWSGLWSAGQRRYWLGERAVVFLNPAGKSGLSSSVDGMEGILPILPATGALAVDVQRLRSRVLRDAGAPMVDSPEQMSLAEVATVVTPPTISRPGSPVSNPSQPVNAPSAPVARPTAYNPVGATFPNAVAAPVQNSVVLVMNPDETDDFLSIDDSDPAHNDSAHKKTVQPDGSR